MAGSGLQELLETVYAANSVKHILTGNAVSRAIRGHLLLYGALQTMLVANAYNLPLPACADDSEEQTNGVHIDPDESQTPHEDNNLNDLEGAAELLDGLLDGESVDDALLSEIPGRISEKIKQERETLTNSRTAQLWFKYMDMVHILCRFIKAERTGNWNLHLSTVQEMLPYFAASGHNLYTKSAYVYLHMCIFRIWHALKMTTQMYTTVF